MSLLLPAGSHAQNKTPATPTKSSSTNPKPVEAKSVSVIIETSLGDIEVALNPEKAPKSVENFLNYVDKGFYTDLIFHRVIPDFMIQGGGFDKNMKLRPPEAPVKNEAHNGLKNLKGTLAMARTPDPHSASSQFFINLKDNDFLNYTSPLPADYGYAVFGEVTKGMAPSKPQATAPCEMSQLNLLLLKALKRNKVPWVLKAKLQSGLPTLPISLILFTL